MNLLIRLALLVALTVPAACAEPALDQATQASRDTFAAMMINAVGGYDAYRIYGYGCYCGLDNPMGVEPVDALDQCCMKHDYDWVNSGDRVEGCDCGSQAYESTVAGGVVTCAGGQSACATYCCEADRDFVACVQPQRPTLNPAMQRLDRTTCEPERATCCEFPTGGLATVYPSECLTAGGLIRGPTEDCFGGPLPEGIQPRSEGPRRID